MQGWVAKRPPLKRILHRLRCLPTGSHCQGGIAGAAMVSFPPGLGTNEKRIAMNSPPADLVMLSGVGPIIRDLIEFPPVLKLFQQYLQRWRKKNCLIKMQRKKVTAQLATLWRDEPPILNADNEQWPARRIYSPDRTKNALFPIPPKLDKKLAKYEGRIRKHSFRSLEKRQDLSMEESIILLAELHDAAYPQHQLGDWRDLIDGVAEATEVLSAGLSQAAVVNLAALVQRVLDHVEAVACSNSRNRLGKSLQEIILRSREKLADLVIRSRPQQTIQGTNSPDETLVSADQLGLFVGVGEKVIRSALNKAGCKPWIESTGKGNPHKWRYCDAMQSLKAVESGKLRSCIWPNSASDLMRRIDSSKIPERK